MDCREATAEGGLMFYCELCRKKNEWPQGFSGSYGPCEVCHKVATCFDVPSKYLPTRRTDATRTR